MTSMEFEGRSEREAVAKAAAELGSESFDVEVLEKSGGLFGRGKVRIRVRALTSIPDPMASGDSTVKKTNGRRKPRNTTAAARMPEKAERPPSKREVASERAERSPEQKERPVITEEPAEPVDPPSDEILKSITDFIEGMIERMGLPGTVALSDREGSKLILEITTESSSLLIGKKGKNLDALQLLANVFLSRTVGDDAPWRIVLDTEGYRARREESLVRLAHKAADEAVRTRSSRLLEPMNPFERRLVHTAINDRDDVVTKSEGDGLYKRVRIMAKSAGRNNGRSSRPRR